MKIRNENYNLDMETFTPRLIPLFHNIIWIVTVIVKSKRWVWFKETSRFKTLILQNYTFLIDSLLLYQIYEISKLKPLTFKFNVLMFLFLSWLECGRWYVDLKPRNTHSHCSNWKWKCFCYYFSLVIEKRL